MSSSSISDRLRRSRITGAVYFVGLLCLLFPLVDLVTNVWPLRPSDVQWRYGAVGLGSGFLLTPLLGLALISLLATIQAKAGILRTAGVVGIAAAVVLLSVTLLFVLDALQVRVGVQEQEQWFFRTAVIRAFGKNLLGSVAFGALGIGAFKSARRAKEARKEKEETRSRGPEKVLVR